jgi:hypothetical protein
MEPMDMSSFIGGNRREHDPVWTERPSGRGRLAPGADRRRTPAEGTCHDQSMTGARRTGWSAALLAVALSVGACGSTTLLGSARPATSRSNASATRARPPGHPAPAAAVAVIRHWAIALQRGDVRAAAGYFEIPSVFADGSGPALDIRSVADARAANEALPCGAMFISAAQHGPFINVLFRLTARPGPGGSNCASGVGQTARTNFVIKAGRITVWLRAPDEPGDNGSPTGKTVTGPVV